MPQINMEGFKEDGLYGWHLTDVKFRQGIRLKEATHHHLKTHSVEGGRPVCNQIRAGCWRRALDTLWQAGRSL